MNRLASVIAKISRALTAWAYLEGAAGAAPPNLNFFVPIKYSLPWFLPNHVYNLWRIAW